MIHRWMLQQIFPKIKVVHFWLIFPPWFAQGARYQQWSPAWLGGICPMIFPVAAAVWLTMATFTPGIFFRARAKTWCWWNWETSQIRYIPRPSKGLRFGTPIECSLRGYVSTPLSRTKKTQQDMVITMFIAPFLGDMVGDELNNKNFDFGEFRHANDTRLPGSDTLPTRIKGRQNDTP